MKQMIESIINSFQNSRKKHLIITGSRGIGKTTLQKALIAKLFGKTLSGFTTYAVPKQKVVLKENKSGQEAAIGMYSGDSSKQSNAMLPVEQGFSFGIEVCKRIIKESEEWVVMDELGYLEQSHKGFQDAIIEVFDKKRVIAVIRKQELLFLEKLKTREDVFVVDLDEKQKKIGCILMASGIGRRFGGNKLLASFRGKMLIERILETTKEVKFARRVVVTRSKEVAEFCEKQNIEVILHEFPNRNDTVRLGVTHLAELDGWIFCPCDQPLLQKESVRKMVMYENLKDDTILRLAFGQEKGSPVLFGKKYREELCTLPEKSGGGYVMKKYPEKVECIFAQSELELYDIDTKEALEELEGKCQIL